MPTIELIAENKWLRERAALWKRCAKKIKSTVWFFEETENFIRAEKAEAELDALKKDARVLAEFVRGLPQISGPLDEEVLFALRNIEATGKERKDEMKQYISDLQDADEKTKKHSQQFD